METVPSVPISRLFVHPIKGLTPVEETQVELKVGFGIPGDRAFAFHFVDAEPALDPRSFGWASKKTLANQNDWPALASLRCTVDRSASRLKIERGGKTLIEGSLETDRPKLARFMTEFLKAQTPSERALHPGTSELELVGSLHSESRFPDRRQVHVSILNLASLRAVSEALGKPVDIRSFRGNLIVDSGRAWDELSWVGQTFRAGSALLEIRAPIGRCHNVNVHPESGDDRSGVLQCLRQSFGHEKFGVLAAVIRDGAIRVGDQLIHAGPAAVSDASTVSSDPTRR